MYSQIKDWPTLAQSPTCIFFTDMLIVQVLLMDLAFGINFTTTSGDWMMFACL